MALKTRLASTRLLIVFPPVRTPLKTAWQGGCTLALALSLASCVTKPVTPPPTEPGKFVMYEWSGDAVKGDSSIIIYLDQQKADFYKGKEKVGWTYIASGTSSHPTPSGSFRIQEKVPNKVSNLYGTLVDANGDVVDSDFNAMKETLPEGCQFRPAKMPMFMRLTGDGVGMHVGKIPKPGRAASHGCIRLPRDMAEKFYANVGIGTPVTIHAETPAAPEKKARF
ncbi:hypothetical protein BH11VER1_BH11VER1_20930 [soil metagenome]